jgi:hypothetical protein
MSDNLATATKAGMPRFSAADTQILAQVEKWMALIREIKRERTKEPVKN